jgi:hypothetical protein
MEYFAITGAGAFNLLYRLKYYHGNGEGTWI